MATLSTLSTEYITVEVSATVNGVVRDPTADTVQFAFIPDMTTKPVSGDWVSGSWELQGTKFLARCLVGPSGVKQLVTGTYKVWVKITDSPEVPVLQVPSSLIVV